MKSISDSMQFERLRNGDDDDVLQKSGNGFQFSVQFETPPAEQDANILKLIAKRDELT